MEFEMVIWAALIVLAILTLLGMIPVAVLAWSVIVGFVVIVLTALLT